VPEITPVTPQSSTKVTPSFEESLEALHNIVSQLETGSLPLDETIEKFKEGSRLAAECKRQIEEAELRVTELAMESSSEPASFPIPNDEIR